MGIWWGGDFYSIEKVYRLRSWCEEWKGLFGWIIMIIMEYNKLGGEQYEIRSTK